MDHHSPTSQYGQLSRRGDRYDHLDVAGDDARARRRHRVGRFADEWDAERDAGYPRLHELKAAACSPEIIGFERDLRAKLGELVPRT